MRTLLKEAEIWSPEGLKKGDVLLLDDMVEAISFNGFGEDMTPEHTFDFSDCVIFPGFVDVHVHFREPGFSYKETIKTGSMAAAHGGYTTVCTMPNLKPCPNDLKTLDLQREMIHRDATIKVIPYGTITVDEKGESLSDIEAMAPYVCGFSDDGTSVDSLPLLEEAMIRVKKTGKILAEHCEDKELVNHGYIHQGDYASKHGHRGISSESEWKIIDRDLKVAEKTGCPYHVCHVSTAESVEVIRQAKARGVDVTCETAPHYLVLTDEDLQEDGRFKMNPPLRSAADRQALLEGLTDGTIDMIATDHAPHSSEEKKKGLEGSAFGIVGLETAFPILYTKLVKTGLISLDLLISKMTLEPAKRFGFSSGIFPGQAADLTVYQLNHDYVISSDDFLSKGKATPFEGEQVYGQCMATFCDGKLIWMNQDKGFEAS